MADYFTKLKRFNPRHRSCGSNFNNGERAERAERIIKQYKHAELGESGPENESDVADLLSDLLHWLHREKSEHVGIVKFLGLVEGAHYNFTAETNE